MVENQPAMKSYFIGVGGKQLGPFTQEEVTARILSNSVTSDALAWFEGLSDWKPIGTLPEFKSLFGATSDAPAPSPSMSQTTEEPFLPTDTAPPDGELSEDYKPVFGETDAAVGGNFFESHRKWVIRVAATAAVVLVGGYLWLTFSRPGTAGGRKAKRAAGEAARSAREIAFNQAVSQLLLDPGNSIPALKQLIKTKADDVVGKEAIQALVDYYKQLQNPADAGRVYLEAGQPADAAPLLMQDPSSRGEAEKAYFAAYEKATGENRRNFLVKDIELLLAPQLNLPLAIKRIRLLVQDFPNEPNPYAYYLKTTDEQIQDLFSRVSFFYVQGLVNYLNSELPQLVFLHRPLVEIRKDPLGRYRIIATYQGDLQLNQDRLKNIFFVFWFAGGQWNIVDTNLTRERHDYAATQRTKLQEDTMDGARMLHALESVFHTQFPKSALHESVKPPQIHGRDDE